MATERKSAKRECPSTEPSNLQLLALAAALPVTQQHPSGPPPQQHPSGPPPPQQHPSRPPPPQQPSGPQKPRYPPWQQA
eukprot:8086407-Alexandrium_andersonii.AAC.1